MSQEPVQLDLLDWLAGHASEPALAVPSLQPSNPPADTGPLLLTRVDPSCNMCRFYSMALATSLFGEAGVVRQWGRIGSQGQSRTDWYEGTGAAEAARKKLVDQKQRRPRDGYSCTRSAGEDTSRRQERGPLMADNEDRPPGA